MFDQRVFKFAEFQIQRAMPFASLTKSTIRLRVYRFPKAVPASNRYIIAFVNTGAPT